MVGTVERAFQLAPYCRTMDALRNKLVREGYPDVDAHLQTGVLRSDLRKRLKRAIDEDRNDKNN